MKEIVRSALAREREINGTRMLIEPPTVRDAFEILVTYEGYRDGQSAAKGVFTDALRRWLPSDLAQEFTQEDVDRELIVQHVLQLILEGIPEAEERAKSGSELKHPFRSLLGSYARVYGADPYLVYTKTPWPFFLLFSLETTRQGAMEQLSAIRSYSATKMTEEGSKKLLQDLEKDMGIVKVPADEKEHEKKAAEDGLAMLQALKQEQDARSR